MFQFIKDYFQAKKFKKIHYDINYKVIKINDEIQERELPFSIDLNNFDDYKNFNVELNLYKDNKLNKMQLDTLLNSVYGMNYKMNNIRNFFKKKQKNLILFDKNCFNNCKDEKDMLKIFYDFITELYYSIVVVDNLNR